MKTFAALLKRNISLFFKDKGLFFTSLITPVILLILYISFLGNVFENALLSSVPEGFQLSDNIVKAFAGSQLMSSILAVSCVTVAFCSNMLMVQDKVNGSVRDFTVSPVKSSVMALSYYFSSLFSTLIIGFAAAGICFIYIGKIGWYLSFSDVLLILLDVFILVLMGTALSSIINIFLNSQGQISAVGAMVSSAYGFICGAYMPLSQFPEGLQKAVSFLPGTYGTSLLRNHSMRAVLYEMKSQGLSDEIIKGLRDGTDCNIYFFDKPVEISSMYIYLLSAVAVLIIVYVILNIIRNRKAK